MDDTGRSYLSVGKWRMRVPRKRGSRIALGLLMLVRGLVPSPTSPIVLSAAVLLLSKDIAWLRRWRRHCTVLFYRRRPAARRQAPLVLQQ